VPPSAGEMIQAIFDSIHAPKTKKPRLVISIEDLRWFAVHQISPALLHRDYFVTRLPRMFKRRIQYTNRSHPMSSGIGKGSGISLKCEDDDAFARLRADIRVHAHNIAVGDLPDETLQHIL
jgi:hypothetical protein